MKPQGYEVRTLPLLETSPLPREKGCAFSPPTFEETLSRHGLAPLRARAVHTLQINVGKLCNQTCHHCHVDAGPHRSEVMSRETMEQILAVLRRYPSLTTVDITGGAPEMNPHFEFLVATCRDLGRHVKDRCNLTVLFMKGKEHLPQFLADHQVEIIASLPCYLETNVDQQRGRGVFERSIAALRRLNAVGYGQAGSGLLLNLVYNPLGAKLPPDQAELEAEYREVLRTRFGIQFTHLYTLTNMPISRFLDELFRTDGYEAYLELLVTNFNPHSVEGLMCRTMLSVGWDGRLYDCDFNQMLDLAVSKDCPQTISDLLQPGKVEPLVHRRIVTDIHCYGCTAGAGSSCSGALT
ncbi:MAG: radical SAM/Cys-rich domain protein [Nitrospirae bacterium]|nr:MAG: radical SAM/Cys-rich domain protein [Nitrospirota bacterium]